MRDANDGSGGEYHFRRQTDMQANEQSTEEIRHLQRRINDLESVLAMPAGWAGSESGDIARTLVDTLLSMLSLDFAYARLNDPEEEPSEFVRVGESLELLRGQPAICELVRPWLGADLSKWPRFVKSPDGNENISIVTLPLGLQHEFGLVVAGSQRPDFPDKNEKLALDVAANQASIGLLAAHRLREQKGVAIELDRRVAQRTAELAAASGQLEREISERRRAEEALRESERMSRLIVDNIPGLVALLTANGEVEVVNRQLLEYFGQSLDELTQWGTNGTVHPEDLPDVVEIFTRSIKSGTPYKIEQRLRRADGVYRWIQNSGFPIRDTNGHITRWCVLLTDIDERKSAEDALQRSKRDLKLIIDTIPALAWSARTDGTTEFFSQHYLDFVGLSPEQAMDWGWTIAVHPEDLDGLTATWRSILASEEPGEGEARMRRFDGEYRWFLFRVNPLRDESGKVVKWYGQNTDIEDRKRGELLLRESERQFKTIFDEAGAGISLVDLTTGEPIRNNRALREMLGCSEEELGRLETYDRLTHEADRDKDATAFRELCGGERDSLRIEKHFVLKDGRSIWANVIFTLLRDDDGRPRYIIAIHEDISERKLVLEKLQANQDLLDLAQKSAGAIAFDWYVQEEINHWPPEQEALFGLAPGTFDGTYKGWKKMMYAPDWSTVVDAIKHAQKTGEVSVEYRVVWPDGSLHWLATNGRMFFDDEGKPLRMVGFTSDVTRRKSVEEELRRSEALLAEGQHLARMGNFSWRVATDEITWSEQLYRIFEFEPGMPMTFELLATRVHPDDVALLYDMVDRARCSVSDFEYEHRLLMPDNSVKYLHLIAHRTCDELGRLEYIGAVQDVTQRRSSEEALSEARSELARAARALSLGVLTASIAHEVNQPLSGIITNANTCVRMLDADPPNVDGARETARRTIRDGNRASDVIKRLRALFGKKEFAAEPLDLNEVALEVIALSRSELQRNQVVLQTEFAQDLPTVDGDRVQLQQVILNLLRNGSDAMNSVNDRPRQLAISTERVGDHVQLTVKDAGVGFVPQVMNKLFDAFYTTKNDGMGIGLSISKSIIETHRGRLWASPNDGHGAAFSFSIPYASESANGASGPGSVEKCDLTDAKNIARNA